MISDGVSWSAMGALTVQDYVVPRHFSSACSSLAKTTPQKVAQAEIIVIVIIDDVVVDDHDDIIVKAVVVEGRCLITTDDHSVFAQPLKTSLAVAVHS